MSGILQQIEGRKQFGSLLGGEAGQTVTSLMSFFETFRCSFSRLFEFLEGFGNPPSFCPVSGFVVLHATDLAPVYLGLQIVIGDFDRELHLASW